MKISGKDEIRLQALEIISYDGLDKLTMSVLADRAGLSKAALYHYYRSKEEILDDIYASGHRHLMEKGFLQKLSGNAEEDLLSLSGKWLDIFRDDENYMYLRLLTSLHLVDQRAEEEYRSLLLMLQGQASVVISDSLLSRLFSSLLFSRLEEILREDSDDDMILKEIRDFSRLVKKNA